VHTDLLGVSSLQAQQKVTQADRAENQKLSDLLTAKNKEIAELKHSSNELEETVSALRQQVQGQSLFIYIQRYCYYMYVHSYIDYTQLRPFS